MNTSKDILNRFIDNLGDKKLWPPLNNYSLFVFGSEYNTERYSWSKIYGEKIKYDILNVSDGEKAVVYLPEQALRSMSENIFSKYLKDKEILQKFESEFYKNFPAVDCLYSDYGYEKISHTDFETLQKKVIESFDLIMSSNAWSHFSIAFDKDICLKCLKENNSPIDEQKLDEIWDTAIVPYSKSFDKAQETQVLESISSGKDLEDIVEDCQYFYATYKDVQSIEETLIRLKNQYGFLSKEDAHEKLKEINNDYEIKKNNFNNWSTSLTREQQDIAKYIQTVIKIRDNRKNFFAKMFVVSWRIAERMCKEAGISLNNIINIMPISELSKGPKYLAEHKEEILSRSKGYVALIPVEGGVELSYDNPKEIKEKIAKIYERLEEQKDVSTIKGQVGCRGLVSGKIKIILDIDDAKNFKEGDILVTGMTRPEFVPLMKISSAIITDEGGITCHAAIVSRELAKPCVIGTKIATKILKDGNLVEVDANNGIVRIID